MLKLFSVPTWGILGLPQSEVTWLLQVTVCVCGGGLCLHCCRRDTAVEMLLYRKEIPSQSPSLYVAVDPSGTDN